MARGISLRIGSLSSAFLVQTIGLVIPVVALAAVLAVSGIGTDVDWAWLAHTAPLTALFIGLGYAVYYTGLERGSVSIASTMTSARLLVAVVIAAVAFSEHVDLTQALLIAAVMAGIVMLALKRGATRQGSTGVGYGIASMLLLGSAFAMWKPLTEAGGPLLAVVSVRALSSLVVLAYVGARRVRPAWPGAPGGVRLLFVAAFLDAGGFVAYNMGLDSAPLTVIAPIAAAHPLATIVLARCCSRSGPRASKPVAWASCSRA
jgi:drug/metabolite transporter (DMT)-like permease